MGINALLIVVVECPRNFQSCLIIYLLGLKVLLFILSLLIRPSSSVLRIFVEISFLVDIYQEMGLLVTLYYKTICVMCQ